MEQHPLVNLIRSIAYDGRTNNLLTTKQLGRVNRVLIQFIPERSDKLAFLSYVFERPFTTSKELKVPEAFALLAFMYYDDWQPNPAFKDFTDDFLKRQGELNDTR
jgi:hypothetical protein